MCHKIRYFFRDYGAYLLAVMICLCSINSWSLWLDESSTAFLASQRTLNSLFETLGTWNGSESQMPGYILSVFAWEKIFGCSEYALRSFNFLLVAIMLTYFLWMQSRWVFNEDEKWLIKLYVLLSFISPIVIYNMNEARVNISVFVWGTISLASALAYSRYKEYKDLLIAMISFAVGYSFNLLFIIVGIPVLAILLYADKKIIGKIWKSLLPLIVIMAMVSIYYLQTLNSGKGGMKELPGVVNIGYSLYELLGFGGVCFPKNEIRNNSDFVMKAKDYLLPTISLLVAYAGIIIGFVKQREGVRSFTLFGVSFLCFFVLAFLAGFRFWGRHLLLIYPILLYTLAEVLYSMRSSLYLRFMACVFLCACAWGTIRIIVLDRYKKEDVKKAIAIINKQNEGNEPVYYLGFDKLASYYHLNNSCSTDDLSKVSKGYILYHKNMGVYYKMTNPKILRQLHSKEKPIAELIWEDRDSELYIIKK